MNGNADMLLKVMGDEIEDILKRDELKKVVMHMKEYLTYFYTTCVDIDDDPIHSTEYGIN